MKSLTSCTSASTKAFARRRSTARGRPLTAPGVPDDVETGEPLAIITTVLAASACRGDSAIGTALMAREDCGTLGLLGSGGMARSHVEALLEVREFKHLKVFSPTRANRERLQPRSRSATASSGEALLSPREAYRGADILAACTDSRFR